MQPWGRASAAAAKRLDVVGLDCAPAPAMSREYRPRTCPWRSFSHPVVCEVLDAHADAVVDGALRVDILRSLVLPHRTYLGAKFYDGCLRRAHARARERAPK